MEYWRSLPVDVAEEILSRIPAKTVARLRSTSKQWNALLKSESFAKIHSDKALKEESLIAPSLKVEPQFYLKDPFSSSSQVYICNVFHCDGLLLCTTEDNRLVVWNPCLGETTKSSCKQYIILRVDRQDIPIKNEYEIYDFTSNSWRVLGVATDWFLALYRTPHAWFLLSFDFSTERFQSMSLPLPHPFPYVNAALSVVGEEQICLLCTDSKVWVPNSTGSVEHSKSLAVGFYRDKKDNNILHILCKDKYTNTHIKGDNIGGDSTSISSSCSVLLNYVPSLAQIQQ
ncbi:hypothetical protein EUTSA_v10022121mg, partial [Eutrema salsugineum]